ncbi:MAG: hypothetical protein RRB22_10845 [Gammaproteobacteria bacterium]|nr:hypothetical protein [Gammaproteobacteria bacterium]
MAKSVVYHLFLYVVSRVDDPFEGIKSSLTDDSIDCHQIIDIRFNQETYSHIREIEYSSLKYIRVIFYRKIFKELDRHIGKVVSEIPDSAKVVIYLADEGVWAELLKVILMKRGIRACTVNVQHGFFLLVRRWSEGKWSVFPRKLINTFSRVLTGYPVFGLAFGRGGFDVYLCYGEREKTFLLDAGNKNVYVCPKLIKSNLWHRYQKALKNQVETQDQENVLIAMPACVPGSEIKCDLNAFMEMMCPLIMILVKDLKINVIVRFHPGRDKNECNRCLSYAGVSGLVQIDESSDVAEGISKSVAVIAAHSTVLFEAALLGKVPIAVRSRCFRGNLPYKHEIVDVNMNYREMLVNSLANVTRKRYSSTMAEYEFNWVDKLQEVVGIAVT